MISSNVQMCVLMHKDWCSMHWQSRKTSLTGELARLPYVVGKFMAHWYFLLSLKITNAYLSAPLSVCGFKWERIRGRAKTVCADRVTWERDWERWFHINFEATQYSHPTMCAMAFDLKKKSIYTHMYSGDMSVGIDNINIYCSDNQTA